MKVRHLAVALGLLSFAPIALAFSDVRTESSVNTSVQFLQSQGIVEGYSDGTFRPNARVNRAEFLKVLMNAAPAHANTRTDVRCFADFLGPERWYWRTACEAKAAAIVQGYPDGDFKGERFVNTAEALKMAVLAFHLPLPQYFRAPDHWYDPYFDALSTTDVFFTVSRTPDHLLTRGEMADVIAILLRGGNSALSCNGHPVGTSYIGSDGCNTCSCTENGEICTKMACVETKCFSTDDCRADQICSTELGDCQSACPPGNEMCIQVCAGTCQKKDSAMSCPDRKKQIDQKFANNLSCNTDSDCGVFIRGCSPYLTCGKAVRKDAIPGLEQEVSTYADLCSTEPMMCAGCMAQTAVCRSGLCVLK